MSTSSEDVSSTLRSPLPSTAITGFPVIFLCFLSYVLFSILSLYSLFTIPFEMLWNTEFPKQDAVHSPGVSIRRPKESKKNPVFRHALLSLTLMGIVHAFEMKLSCLNSKSVRSCLFAKQRTWNWEAVWLHVLCKFIVRANLKTRHQGLSCTRHFSHWRKVISFTPKRCEESFKKPTYH